MKSCLIAASERDAAGKSCCLCFGLRGGAKTIGVLLLVIALMQLGYVIVLWAGLVVPYTPISSVRTPGGEISSDGRQHRWLTGFEWMVIIGNIPFIYYIAFVLLALIFNSMLIHGTDHDSSCAVLAWLVFYIAVYVVITAVSIVLLIAPDLASSGNVLGVRVVAGVGLMVSSLLWYWWGKVLKFYRELRDGTRGYRYHRDVSLQEPPTPHSAA